MSLCAARLSNGGSGLQSSPGAAELRDVAPENVETGECPREKAIDDELAQSFPASDPPGWVLGIASTPVRDGSKS